MNTNKIHTNKQVFIINGMARSGKDTFVDLVTERLPIGAVMNYSSIDKIKEIAKKIGWDGRKTERDRKFLSDLKVLCTGYNDLPFRSLRHKVEEFYEDHYAKMLFLHIREPEEIERAKEAFRAKTISIIRPSIEQITSNMADAGVFDYDYDFVIENNGTLDDFYWTVYNFAKENILNDE